MENIEAAVARLPLRTGVVDQAFAHFRETGELPEQQRLADAVCRRALGGDYAKAPSGDPTSLEALILTTVASGTKERHGPPSVRESVLHEAVFCDGIVQRGARLLLKHEVDFGADVTDPQFLADKTLPDHPGVGLHLLGFPERLAKPPYVAQAHRLFARYADLRHRINRTDDDPWFETYIDAVIRFQDNGDLPDDELLRDAVLADAEMEALWAHRCGQDVGEMMAALDKAARAKGPRRADAIEAVQDFMRARVGPTTPTPQP